MKNTYYYKGANHTVDLLLVAPTELKDILMIVRSDTTNACPNMLAFPGGFVDTESKRGELWRDGLETHKNAALRELKEETGLELINVDKLMEVGVYEGGGRDPRDNTESWARSEAFVYLLSEDEYNKVKGKEQGMDDAKAALWIPLDALRGAKLAFDHNKILEDAMGLINKKVTKNKM